MFYIKMPFSHSLDFACNNELVNIFDCWYNGIPLIQMWFYWLCLILMIINYLARDILSVDTNAKYRIWKLIKEHFWGVQKNGGKLNQCLLTNVFALSMVILSFYDDWDAWVLSNFHRFQSNRYLCKTKIVFFYTFDTLHLYLLCFCFELIVL